MRWQDTDGVIWASRFEYEVFTALKGQGYDVRKTTSADSLDYTSAIRSGRCTECYSCKVVQERSFTADIHVTQEKPGLSKRSVYYIEVKGFLRAEQRTLLRALRKARPDVDIRLVVQRDYRVSKKHTIVSWATTYLKVPVIVWNGALPDGWK